MCESRGQAVAVHGRRRHAAQHPSRRLACARSVVRALCWLVWGVLCLPSQRDTRSCSSRGHRRSPQHCLRCQVQAPFSHRARTSSSLVTLHSSIDAFLAIR